MVNLKEIEAVLFAVGKEISLDRISTLTECTPETAKELLIQLAKKYQETDNALQVVEKENGWKLTVLDQYVPLVSDIVHSTELERPLMETLAVIAWKYPVVQSDIIRMKGSVAYEHMRNLEERGFISKERSGRTYTVKLTSKFFQYFDLPTAATKQAFLEKIPSEVIAEAEAVEKEAKEVEDLIEREKREEVSKNEIKEAMKELHEEQPKE